MVEQCLVNKYKILLFVFSNTQFTVTILLCNVTLGYYDEVNYSSKKTKRGNILASFIIWSYHLAWPNVGDELVSLTRLTQADLCINYAYLLV